MTYGRRLLGALLVLFAIFYIITRPESAAGAVQTVFDALATAYNSLVTFFSALAS